ncbi:hypothetical protein KAI65_02990 [Candidatus Parcubacteria bacterium]|nr:hypothetical protein [Candidatus Parcubacteria bacterium]
MLKRKFKFTFIFTLTIVLVFGLSISLQSLLAAWTAPTNNPPAGNISPPIYNEHPFPNLGNLINLPLTINDYFLVGVQDFFVEKNLCTETLGERGYVGIGTLSPQAELHITSESGDDSFLNSRNYTALRIENTVSHDSVWELRALHFDVALGVNNDFAIWGGYEGDKAYRFFIKGDPGINIGNVGINDLNPTAKLNILNSTTTLSFLVEDDVDGDATPFVIDESGNVGIKKINPGYELDVNGAIKGTDYRSGDGSQGLTRTVIVKDKNGVNCNLIFKDGLLTAETCP